jgi:hypothetical protein
MIRGDDDNYSALWTVIFRLAGLAAIAWCAWRMVAPFLR